MFVQRAMPLALLSFFCLSGLLSANTASKLPQVYTAAQTYGPFSLASEQLQQMPAGIKPVRFEEATWLVGYSTEVIDGQGAAMPREMHCHTMMMTSMGTQGSHHEMNATPFKGVYSDGYTPAIKLPPGFGIFFDAGESLDLAPMFNNRANESIDASMRVEAHFVLDSELSQPLTPLYSTIQSVAAPHLYMVPPGEDVRELEISMPYDGTIHAMGVHIHPYGRAIELIESDSGKTVWKSVGEVGDDGRLLRMPFYSSVEGYTFKADQRFLLRATYDNVTDQEQDAMAGLFIFFSTPDGKAPAKHHHH